MKNLRDKRNLKQGERYHIYNRGNRRRRIFHDDSDYSYFIGHLQNYSKQYGQEIMNYCIMYNHFHLTVEMGDTSDFIRMMRDFTSKIAKRHNEKYDTVGHMFQDKYKHRRVTDLKDLLYLSRYVHRNPLDIKSFQGKLHEYKWSSLSIYLAKASTNTFIQPRKIVRLLKNKKDYGRLVVSTDFSEHVEILKRGNLRVDLDKDLIGSMCPTYNESY